MEDSTIFVAYIPHQQQVTINCTSFKTKKIFAQWFNPRTGKFSLIGHFQDLEYFYFTPPSDEDWVLYLKTE